MGCSLCPLCVGPRPGSSCPRPGPPPPVAPPRGPPRPQSSLLGCRRLLIRLASVRRLFSVAWCARLAVRFTFLTCGGGAGEGVWGRQVGPCF